MTPTPTPTTALATTLGALKQTGYQSRTIKQELRDNLIAKLTKNEPIFEGIFGFEDSVIPDLQRAILSRHNILMLGLRGQAKTRIARLMVQLLDEYMPIVAGSEINDCPLQPLSSYARDMIATHADNTPVAWVHRSQRYTEKLATPDVTVADLIGDSDPIKAANLKLSYSDEKVIHFGLIPRSHRSIFVINELPDLQPRIQVALFNILQEGDIQIRGFKLRLPLDIQFVFTANPEDYTNRGSIVTPLKDRIESQILTHYPKTLEISKNITQQEANILPMQQKMVQVPEILKDLIEEIAFEARKSEYVDAKSGVSARLTISAYENLVSAAELRCITGKQKATTARISDLFAAATAITGKIELVYEGEQEGPGLVAKILVKQAIKTQFLKYFPNPDKLRKSKDKTNPYKTTVDWFAQNNDLDLLHSDSDKLYAEKLAVVDGLKALLQKYMPDITQNAEQNLYMEFVLHGLAECSLISKSQLETQTSFKDLMSSMLGGMDFEA
jgi:magnesium chelatase subunit I